MVNACPYCRENIDAEAIVCKHCHSNLEPTRKEMAIARIRERIAIDAAGLPAVAIPKVTACGASCQSRFKGNKTGLAQCLKDCEAAAAVAAMAERLHRELAKSFIDYVWQGGNIDPVPFEKSIREGFARGG